MRKICILMRTKDRPVFLARALQSVLAQTEQDWTISLINDGGDRTALEAQITAFQNQLRGRLRIVNFPKSEGRGTGKHLNAGLVETASEFVAIHDDDDSWHPQFLERALGAIGAKQGVVTQSLLVKERVENNAITEISREVYEPWQQHEISLFRLAESLSFPPIAFLFRRSAMEKIGGFRDELGPLEDWEFALRFFAAYPVEFLEEPLAYYHQREGTAGETGNSKVNAAKIYAKLDIQIRNELLREDLRSGKFGLGSLVNLADRMGHLYREINKKP